MVCTSPQLNLLSASRRHVADAERLRAESPDQAWHLAGFGPECARKVLVFDTSLAPKALHQSLGHDFSGRSDEALLEWVLRLDPHAHRYAPTGWSTAHPALTGWRPDHRYDPTGTVVTRARPLDDLLAAARHLVDRVTADLWMDGQLPSTWRADL